MGIHIPTEVTFVEYNMTTMTTILTMTKRLFLHRTLLSIVLLLVF